MHELAVTRAALEQSLAEAERRGARRITRVNLRVGEAAGVVPECVRFYFEQLGRGTIAEGAGLEFRRTPVRIRCPKCGREAREVDDLCGCNAGGELVSGDELLIESIDIE
ncbi:hydrogenase maturation nickel metallochaperone HypA [candidate division WOR-3 bacterium]|nr:hydrogenase maturation nickel metallochaperone HypA [candidate division WOR-3 bacterium]